MGKIFDVTGVTRFRQMEQVGFSLPVYPLHAEWMGETSSTKKGGRLGHPQNLRIFQRLVAKQNSGAKPHVVVVGRAIGMQREPVELDGA